MSAAYHFEKQSSPQPWPILFSLLLLWSSLFLVFYLEEEEREGVERKRKNLGELKSHNENQYIKIANTKHLENTMLGN